MSCNQFMKAVIFTRFNSLFLFLLSSSSLLLDLQMEFGCAWRIRDEMKVALKQKYMNCEAAA